ILRYNVNFAPEDLLRNCAEFLQESHRYRLDYSTRDGINIMRFALKLHEVRGTPLKEAFDRAVSQVLGEGAANFEERARGSLIDDNAIDFASFFGNPPMPGGSEETPPQDPEER
ncbi:MAG: hypothetical protein V3T77_08785, partial [Planctomycetota bacterium]